MHNHQRHLKPNNISKLGVIVLSIILLIEISFIPAFQAGVYAQQSQSQQQGAQQQQQNRIGISQVIKQIAQQVATANPGTNVTHVYQILVQLAKQTAQTASQAEAIKEIRQISSQVTAYPFGTLSQVLSHFAQRLASGNSNVAQIVQQAVQEKASSGSSSNNITQTLSNAAVQEASGGSTNVNLVIRNAAQLLAKRAGVPVEKVEAVIIQIALQISQAQGKTITAQSIFQLANQIIQDPNGVLSQAILKLVKQDDGGKSSHTTTIIKNVVKSSGGGSHGSSGHRGNGRGNGGDSDIICKNFSCNEFNIQLLQQQLQQVNNNLPADGNTAPEGDAALAGETAAAGGALAGGTTGTTEGGASPDTDTTDGGVAALDTGDEVAALDTGGGGDTSSDGDSSDSSDSNSGDSGDSSDSSSDTGDSSGGGGGGDSSGGGGGGDSSGGGGGGDSSGGGGGDAVQ